MDQCVYVHQIAHTTLCKLVGPLHFPVKKKGKKQKHIKHNKTCSYETEMKWRSSQTLQHTATKLILLVSSTLYWNLPSLLMFIPIKSSGSISEPLFYRDVHEQYVSSTVTSLYCTKQLPMSLNYIILLMPEFCKKWHSHSMETMDSTQHSSGTTCCKNNMQQLLNLVLPNQIVFRMLLQLHVIEKCLRKRWPNGQTIRFQRIKYLHTLQRNTHTHTLQARIKKCCMYL